MRARAIPSFEKYSVSDTGIVSGRKGALKQRADKWGYMKVGLSRKGKQFHKFVHRLVLEAFVGPCPEGMQTRHLDGNPKNNALENLVWGTKRHNEADKIKCGTSNRGGKNHFCKMNEATAREIKMRLKQGERPIALSREYGLHYSTIFNFKNGRSWAWLDVSEEA